MQVIRITIAVSKDELPLCRSFVLYATGCAFAVCILRFAGCGQRMRPLLHVTICNFSLFSSSTSRAPLIISLGEGWRLPKCGAKEMWNMWWFGNKSDRIRPYRELESWNLKEKSDRDRLSKVRGAMDKIEEEARKKKLIEEGKTIEQLTPAESLRIFDTAYTEVLRQLRTKTSGKRKHRSDQISLVTVYEHLIGWGSRIQAQNQISSEQAAVVAEAEQMQVGSEQEHKESL